MLTGLIAIVALAGCGNWSRDVTEYRSVLDGPLPLAKPVFTAADPLPLRTALRLANANNESIASQGENYIQALANKMQQAGTFLPTLTLAPSYGVSRYTTSSSSFSLGSSSLNGSSSIVPGGSYHQTAVPLNGSITGSVSNVSTLGATGATAQQMSQLLLDTRETILLQAAQSYYSALKAQHQASVYETSLLLKEEKVRDQEARLKLGSVRPLDLAQSQADLAGTRTSLIQADTDAANARSALARLIGVAMVSGELIDDYEPAAQLPNHDVWQAQAFTHRQDLLAAQRAVEAAKMNLNAAIQQYFPSVTVNLSYFLYNSPATQQLSSSLFSANFPIFSALVIEAGVRRAWSVYRQTGLAESQARRQVTDDVNQGLNNILGSRQRIAELQIEVEAAQRAFNLSERAYKLGSISNLDRLTQQDNLLSAQLTLVSERYSEKLYYLSLLRATGCLASVLTDVRHG